MAKTLKQWRENKGLSQEALAKDLEDYARKKFPEQNKKLPQRTLGYWERGTLPRKFWLSILSEYTNKQVTANSFIVAE